MTHDEIEVYRPVHEFGVSGDSHTATANAWEATSRMSVANAKPSNLPRLGSASVAV